MQSRRGAGEGRPPTRRRSKRPSAAELDVMDRFIRDVRTGKKQSPDKVLRQNPQFEQGLRPALEGMVMLNAEFRRFRKQFPNVDIERLFGIPKSK